jgi:hypothetical protein
MQIESESEQEASFQNSQNDMVKEYSVNEGKLKDFHCRNLLQMGRTIALRNTVCSCDGR